MRLLFWNTYKNCKINDYIVSIVQEKNIDILITAEYSADENELNQKLIEIGMPLTKTCNIGCNRISMWTNFINVSPATQNNHYSIQIINNEYIICGLHLPTNLHGDYSNERHLEMTSIINDINNLSSEINSKKIILIGDMNEMPYNQGCLNADSFHGLPVLNEQDSKYRTVNGKCYKKYYNPMWNLFGNFHYPPGTYYYNNSRLHNPMWYMFDQVIISQELIPFFNNENLEIITDCYLGDLFDNKMHPNKNISDHFSIFCEIYEEV